MNLQIIDIIYYVSCYLFLGTLVTLVIDHVLRKSQIDNPFTFWEAVTTILLWPIVVVLAFVNALKKSDDA